jgi:hypothetical protein
MCTPNLGEAHRRGGTELRGRLVSLLCFRRFFLQLGECCSAFADVFYYPIESFSPEFASFPAQTSVRQDDSEPPSSSGKLFELRPEKLDFSRRLIHLLWLEALLVSVAARVGSRYRPCGKNPAPGQFLDKFPYSPRYDPIDLKSDEQREQKNMMTIDWTALAQQIGGLQPEGTDSTVGAEVVLDESIRLIPANWSCALKCEAKYPIRRFGNF